MIKFILSFFLKNDSSDNIAIIERVKNELKAYNAIRDNGTAVYNQWTGEK